jgi:myosin heavy subunit
MQAGASDAERKEFKLLGSLDDYAYIAGGAYTVDKVDDKKEWEDTIKKLESLGVGGEALKRMLRTIAANFAIGNLLFEKAGPEAFKVKNKEQIVMIAELLEVDAALLEMKMTSRLIKTKTEEYTVNLKENECVDTRDALAKQVEPARLPSELTPTGNSPPPPSGPSRTLIGAQRVTGLLGALRMDRRAAQ